MTSRSAAISDSRGPAAADSARRGDPLEEEVVALYDHFRVPVLRYLASLGVGFADGEEVTQEVFLALFQHIAAGKPRENLRGWLFRTAHNLGLRRRQRGMRECGVGRDGGGQEAATAREPSPEEEAMEGQRQKRLMAVVRALPEQDRRCLSLRAEGLRYREIAGVLNMSLGAVSISLTRSLGRIARAAER